MQLLALTASTPAENLALDEALLLAAEAGTGGPVLRLWEPSTYAVVLGAAGSFAIDVNEAACLADGIPVLRRSSGGGTVVIGSGSLCYSLVLPYDLAPRLNEIVPSIRYVLGRVANALRPVAPAIELRGISDLTIDGRKFSGNAQQRKRKHFLHHGTLLCNFDLTRIAKYLNPPERQPDYRQDRDHADFVTNLDCSTAQASEGLMQEWDAVDGVRTIPWEQMQQLVAEKYGLESWTRRR